MDRMWRISDNPTWKKYKEIAAVRGLLQWVGASGVLMALLSAIGLWFWTRYITLPGPIRFLAVLIAFLSVSGVFAIIRFLVGSDNSSASHQQNRRYASQAIRTTGEIA
jgi:hypothetical protein